MMKIIEAVTVSASVLYVGAVLYSLTVYFQNGGMAELANAAEPVATVKKTPPAPAYSAAGNSSNPYRARQQQWGYPAPYYPQYPRY